MKPRKILSLFSGYAGLDEAVQRIIGGEVVAFAEVDPAATLILAHHFPGIPNLGDVSRIDFRAMRGEVTDTTAGFPCQGLSNAGLRKGLEDARSGLWSEVLRATAAIRPERVWLENVGAIRSRGLNVVAEDLARIGYDLRWTTLRASEIGYSHHRSRWFGLATPSDTDSA